jgi:hypothetical protein
MRTDSGDASENGAITASKYEPSSRHIRYVPCIVPTDVVSTQPDVY